MSKGKRNTFYNKQKWEEVNPNNKFLLEDYKSELEVQGKSKGTIYQYASDIRNFLCWVVDHAKNEDVLEMKRRPFRDFFLTMQRNGSSPARVNRMQSSIRNMLEYAYNNEDDYELDRNIMKSIKGLEGVPTDKSIWLTNEEVEFLIDYCLDNDELLKALYVSISYDSAARRNEVYQVEKHNFLDKELNYTNEVIGKRGKRFPLIFTERTRKIALEYLKERGEDDIDSLWVIEDNEGEKTQISDGLFYYWITTLRDPLFKFNEDSTKHEFSPHDLRRSSLENLENGSHYMLKEMGVEKLSIEMVQIFARHSSLETTKKFYLLDKTDEEFNSLFGIKQ